MNTLKYKIWQIWYYESIKCLYFANSYQADTLKNILDLNWKGWVNSLFETWNNTAWTSKCEEKDLENAHKNVSILFCYSNFILWESEFKKDSF